MTAWDHEFDHTPHDPKGNPIDSLPKKRLTASAKPLSLKELDLIFIKVRVYVCAVSVCVGGGGGDPPHSASGCPE